MVKSLLSPSVVSLQMVTAVAFAFSLVARSSSLVRVDHYTLVITHVLTRCLGTAVQSTAHTTGQFIGGRFVLGFGASIASAAGPAYTVELAHPSYRGTMAGMYNNCKLPLG